MERLSGTSANAEGRRAMIIVRTATGEEVQGWRMTHPGGYLQLPHRKAG